MASKNNDQRLLDRALEDKRSILAPQQKMNDFFNYFSAQLVLQDLDFGIDEIRDGIVDGAHDCGVDGIWVMVDDRYVSADIDRRTDLRAKKIELVILQAKTSPGYQETTFEKLHYHLPLLLDIDRDVDELSESTNAKLLDRTARFLHVLEATATGLPDIHVRVVYVTRSVEQPHPNVLAKGNRLKRELDKVSSGTRCSVEYLGAPELRERIGRGAAVRSELVFIDTPMSTGFGEGYVCLARLDEYYRFITSHNDALRLELFESNVRDYAGRTAVNGAIRETLATNHRDDFWWFNNGVTLVAGEVRIIGKRIVMTDPQIVNGLQTSHEIYSYFQNGGRHHDRALLVRIMVPPSSGRSRDGIIRATNSQTQLPPGALRATEKIQKDIEESLARDGYYYERRANYYKNLGFRLEQVVSVPRLAREFTAFVLGEPHTALQYSEGLLLEDDHYNRVFSAEQDLDLYRIVLDVHVRVDEFLASYMEDHELLGDTAENWRYHISYASSFALTRMRRATAKDLLGVKTENLTDDLLLSMVNVVRKEYNSLLRGNRARGIDRIARSGDLAKRIRESMISTRKFKVDS